MAVTGHASCSSDVESLPADGAGDPKDRQRFHGLEKTGDTEKQVGGGDHEQQTVQPIKQPAVAGHNCPHVLDPDAPLDQRLGRVPDRRQDDDQENEHQRLVEADREVVDGGEKRARRQR